MLDKIKSNVIAAIVSAVIIAVVLAIWGTVSDGGLVRSLGGATAKELAKIEQELGTHPRLLKCRAEVSEEHSQPRACSNAEFELATWCSGDCRADDARARLCCGYRTERGPVSGR